MSNSPIFPGSIKTDTLSIANADGTLMKDFVTAGANGSRINSISAVTTESTADVELNLYINDGISDFQIGRLTVPIGSGTDGTNKPVSVLNSLDLPFLGSDLSLYIANGCKLRVGLSTAITSGVTLQLVATSGDY